MIDYIDEIISALNNSYLRGHGIKTSIILEDLYKVDEDCDKFSHDKANMFYNIMAKPLFTTKRAI